MTFLYTLLIAIPIAFALNIILGVVISDLKHSFDKGFLIHGIKKGILIYVSIGLFILLAWLLPELKVTLNGVEVTLFVGIVSSLWSVVFFKTGEAFVKFLQSWKLKADNVMLVEMSQADLSAELNHLMGDNYEE